MNLIAIDSTKTITRGMKYYATKQCGNKALFMNDVGTMLWVNKTHFKKEDK